jgi:predicted DCC family thiol-disulfide oxidoreductase YuxK
MSEQRSILLYDGDCGFCRFWVERWKHRTGDRILYLPNQETLSGIPDIPREELDASVQLITPSGERRSGARAVFEVVASAPGKRWMLWLYRFVPGAAPVSERFYSLVARHRGLFSTVTRILWGRNPEPPSYNLTRALFLKALGLVYLAAFWSLGTQVLGLIGEHGILPANVFFKFVRESYGSDAFWRIPSLGLFDASDYFLRLLCTAGAASSILLIAGVAPVLALVVSWAAYLSLVLAGQQFLSFQWDILLLETGFLAIFFAPRGMRPRRLTARQPPALILGLFRLLLFRLMFFSGFVKLASHDPSWRNLTTLSFHFETQPLPTPPAWYAHHLPLWTLEAACAIMFVIELGVPFLIFAPRRLRFSAAWAIGVFMVLIIVTGNYTFFNFLTLALCLLLFDDAALRSVLPRRWKGVSVPEPAPRRAGAFLILVAALILFMNVVQFWRLLGGRESLPGPVETAAGWMEPFCIVNRYGLFAVMTNPRLEIVVEGSDDGEQWKEYEFKYKPGDVNRPPPWVEPHQPRLDWQMWFAALGSYQNNRWFMNLSVRLLQGSQDVLDLLGKDPFGGKPPRFVRAVLYEYHFTDAATRSRSGAWWKREAKGLYLPQISLRAGR